MSLAKRIVANGESELERDVNRVLDRVLKKKYDSHWAPDGTYIVETKAPFHAASVTLGQLARIVERHSTTIKFFADKNWLIIHFG